MASTTAQKARRHLATITESEVSAMQALDTDTLARLVGLVHTIASDDDVREHAVIIVASLMPGAQSERHAARAAVAIAKRAVALARSLDSWDCYGDMTEDVATTIEDAHTRSGLPRYAPDPASRFAVTYGDLIETACAMVDAPHLTDAARAYVRHARTCQECTDASEQRITLAGVRAHLDGRGAGDASYHSERRAVLDALELVAGRGIPSDVLGYDARLGYAPEDTDAQGHTHGRTGEAWFALARYAGDPAPMAPAHVAHRRVSLGDCAPVSTSDYVAPVRTVMAGTACSSCVHTSTYASSDSDRRHILRRCASGHCGRTWVARGPEDAATPNTYGPRAMTEAEAGVSTAREQQARHAGEEYRGGTHGQVSAQADAFAHAPRAEANTGRATTPGQALPTGAVPVSPRKRPRVGSTGPSVPAW